MVSTPLHGALFIGLVMVLSVAGLVVVRRYADIAWLKRQHDVAGFFFQVIGTLYAVLIAFAIFVVWTQYQDAGTNLEHEANEVGDLSRLAMLLPEPSRAKIHASLIDYLHAVLEDEFPAMAEGRESSRTWISIQGLWQAYSEVNPSDMKDQVYLQESLTHLNQLSDYRRIRIFTARGTVPRMLWYLLVIGGALLIAFTYCFGHEGRWSQAAMTAALAGILAFSLFLIAAYDSPFAGACRVSPVPFQLELRHITSRF